MNAKADPRTRSGCLQSGDAVMHKGFPSHPCQNFKTRSLNDIGPSSKFAYFLGRDSLAAAPLGRSELRTRRVWPPVTSSPAPRHRILLSRAKRAWLCVPFCYRNGRICFLLRKCAYGLMRCCTSISLRLLAIIAKALKRTLDVGG